MNNRMWNAKNPYQGKAKKVLVVCSAGLLRSPTIANLLASPPYNFNTRAVGVEKEYALIPMDDVLVEWADEFVFVNDEVYQVADAIFKMEKPCVVLNINDNYEFGSEDLKQIAGEQLRQEYLY